MDNKVLEFGNYDGDKLRLDNEDSFFLGETFDQAIMGINRLTKSVIYSLDEMLYLEVDARYETGELNFDVDVVDEDILKVCQDTIIRNFKKFQPHDHCIIPTLFEGFDRSIYDWNVNLQSSITRNIEESAGSNPPSKIENMQSKEFSFDQLNSIPNESELHRWIELRNFDTNDVFELIPRELIDFDDEEPIIRCVVKLVDEPYWLGFQDLTFDQWEPGKVINQEGA
jgi:hypothetical protein